MSGQGLELFFHSFFISLLLWPNKHLLNFLSTLEFFFLFDSKCWCRWTPLNFAEVHKNTPLVSSFKQINSNTINQTAITSRSRSLYWIQSTASCSVDVKILYITAETVFVPIALNQIKKVLCEAFSLSQLHYQQQHQNNTRLKWQMSAATKRSHVEACYETKQTQFQA